MSYDWYDCKTCGGRHDDAGYDRCPGAPGDRLDALESRCEELEERCERLEQTIANFPGNRT